jgi:hypothetical protein
MTSLIDNHSGGVIVDPHFAIEPRDIVDFLAEFGPFNGRYVPRFPSDWPARLRQHVEELSIKDPVKRQSMLEKIRREALLCTVPVGWKWNDEYSWQTNLEKNADAEKLLIVGYALAPEPFAAWIDALDQIRETRRRTWPFYGSISEYVNACFPLLVNSPAVYLIDPYLDIFSEAGEMLLRSLLDKSRGSRCYSVQIITRRSACGSVNRGKDSLNLTDQEIGSFLERIYKKFLPKDRELCLHLVTEGGPEENFLRMHDRFFLTIHGAINFGKGFFLAKHLQPQMNAFILDREHHILLKQTYIDGVARHREQLPKAPKTAYPRSVNTFRVTLGH